MIVILPQFKIHDWTLPPQHPSVFRFEVNINNSVRILNENDQAEVLGFLTEPSDDRVYIAHGSLLLAILHWRKAKAAKVLHKRLIDDRVRCLTSLQSFAKSTRNFKTAYDRTSQPIDIDVLTRDAIRYEQSENDVFAQSYIDCIAQAGAYLTTWHGVCVDQSRLSEVSSKLEQSTQGGLHRTLRTHCRELKRTLRVDGRIHPVYQRQHGFRFGTQYPNTQTFTSKGGELSSKGLVVPSSGKMLLSIDVRMAELHALAHRWATRFNDSKSSQLLDDLKDGVDLHEQAAEIVLNGNRESLDDVDARSLGKLVNFAMLNLGNVERVNAQLERHELPSVKARDFSRYRDWLSNRYPLAEWHNHAKHLHFPAKLSTHYGRTMQVTRPSQCTGFQFQVPTSDATAFGNYSLWYAGFSPNLMNHDEIVVECDDSDDAPRIIKSYLAGFRRIVETAQPTFRVDVCRNRWGHSDKRFLVELASSNADNDPQLVIKEQKEKTCVS